MYRVLLADDEQIERMALAGRLKKHFGDNLAISEAVNGEEALLVFQEERSQIIIMDISMPVMSGVEAAEQIRRLDEGCNIIFLTAYDDFSYAKRAIVIRALDYILKPCEEEELIAVMEEAMRLTDRRAAALDAGWTGESGPGGVWAGGRGTGGARPGEGALWGGGPGENRYSGGVPADIRRQGSAGGMQEPFLDKADAKAAQVAAAIRDYIKDNYMKEISMQDAARMMNYSDAYFCKLFKQCFGQNFTSYVTQLRVNEAKKLLQDRNASVKDVGRQVGYYDSNYFAKVFKRITGVIPSEYRDGQNSQK